MCVGHRRNKRKGRTIPSGGPTSSSVYKSEVMVLETWPNSGPASCLVPDSVIVLGQRSSFSTFSEEFRVARNNRLLRSPLGPRNAQWHDSCPPTYKISCEWVHYPSPLKLRHGLRSCGRSCRTCRTATTRRPSTLGGVPRCTLYGIITEGSGAMAQTPERLFCCQQYGLPRLNLN